jgi:hypothetical protein
MSILPACWRAVLPALVATLLVAWPGYSGAETADMSREETVTLLMEWLGVADASRQVSRRLERQVNMETRLEQARRQEVLEKLAARISDQQAYQQTWSYLLARYDEKLMSQAVEILRQSPVLSMRELEQHARAGKEVRKLVEAHENAAGKALGSERKALLSRLDGALHATELMLLLQSGVEAQLKTLLAAEYDLPDTMSGPLGQQAREQSEMQLKELVSELVLDYSAYVYRSINDEALQELVEVLEQEALQQVLGMALQGFASALENPVEQGD